MKRNKRPTAYALYCRKSTEGKERQALSIQGQRKWGTDEAKRRGLRIADTFEEEKSAKTAGRRGVFDKLIKGVRRGTYRGILTWKMDRLARNPEEAGIILGLLSRSELEHIVTCEREYRPEDNALISYVDFGMADQYSRDLSINVKRGLRTKLEQGWYPGYAKLGYLNTRSTMKGSNAIIQDPDRFDALQRAWRLMVKGTHTVAEIARLASDEWGLTTRPTGRHPEKPLSRSSWYRIFTDPFYSGWFEHPQGSDDWFQGKHTPMVSPGEFEMVQSRLGSKGRPRGKTRRFEFTGLFRCATCGAMITAEAKQKKLLDGSTRHYVYYHCTKRMDPDCPERSVEVKELEKQIDAMLAECEISDGFYRLAEGLIRFDWKVEKEARRQSLSQKKRELAQLTGQIESLVLKYASPENVDGSLFTDQEFKDTKATLNKRRQALEDQIARHAQHCQAKQEHEIETFAFANRARKLFVNGTQEDRRAMVVGLGSNHKIRSKKLEIERLLPFRAIQKHMTRLNRQMEQVRTEKCGPTERSLLSVGLIFFVHAGMRRRR